MFVDARSTPPRVAAVLVSDGAILYSDMAPSEEVGKFFHVFYTLALLCSTER